jgi:hypothetical protein
MLHGVKVIKIMTIKVVEVMEIEVVVEVVEVVEVVIVTHHNSRTAVLLLPFRRRKRWGRGVRAGE